MATKNLKEDPNQPKITVYTTKNEMDVKADNDDSLIGRLRQRWNSRHGETTEHDGDRQGEQGKHGGSTPESAMIGSAAGETAKAMLGDTASLRKGDIEGDQNKPIDPAVQPQEQNTNATPKVSTAKGPIASTAVNNQPEKSYRDSLQSTVPSNSLKVK